MQTLTICENIIYSIKKDKMQSHKGVEKNVRMIYVSPNLLDISSTRMSKAIDTKYLTNVKMRLYTAIQSKAFYLKRQKRTYQSRQHLRDTYLYKI